MPLLSSGQTTPDILIPIQSQVITPYDFRGALESFASPDAGWWDDNWPRVSLLMCISLAHTGMDLSYSRHGCQGMFAVHPGAWLLSGPIPTEPNSVLVDPEVLIALTSKYGVPPSEMGDWIGVLLAQCYMTRSGVWAAWKFPDPFTTCWQDNIASGGPPNEPIIAPETVRYLTVPFNYRAACGLEGHLFRDQEGEPLDLQLQETLWVLASKGAIYADLWWRPTDARKVLKKALEEFGAGDGVSIQHYASAALALGETSTPATISGYFTKIVRAMTQQPFAFLLNRQIAENGYTRQALDRWLSGRAAGDTARGLAEDIAGAVTGGVSWTWWILIGALALGIVLKLWQPGKGGAK